MQRSPFESCCPCFKPDCLDTNQFRVAAVTCGQIGVRADEMVETGGAIRISTSETLAVRNRMVPEAAKLGEASFAPKPKTLLVANQAGSVTFV